MKIPTSVKKKIETGQMRKKHGLDTSRGSDYFYHRRKGDSDVVAQYKSYKRRRLVK